MSNDARYDKSRAQRIEAGHVEYVKPHYLSGPSKAETRALLAKLGAADMPAKDGGSRVARGLNTVTVREHDTKMINGVRVRVLRKSQTTCVMAKRSACADATKTRRGIEFTRNVAAPGQKIAAVWAKPRKVAKIYRRINGTIVEV